MLLAAMSVNAQTTAVNWTASDCNGINHTLFTELDAGKVIVFVWVMPCGSCINPSKTAYNVVQTFASSYPGKVLYYLADDLGDASCSTLTGWVTTNSIGSTGNMTIFSNAGNVINESDFGGSGMPHVIVMGGPGHQIYFNKKGTAADDNTGINNAIVSAIGATAISSMPVNEELLVFPNPVMQTFTVTGDKEIRKISVIGTNGKAIKSESYPSGRKAPEVDLSACAAGLYFVEITATDGSKNIQKLVKR